MLAGQNLCWRVENGVPKVQKMLEGWKQCQSHKQWWNDESGSGASKMAVKSRQLCWWVRRGVGAWEMVLVWAEINVGD